MPLEGDERRLASSKLKNGELLVVVVLVFVKNVFVDFGAEVPPNHPSPLCW